MVRSHAATVSLWVMSGWSATWTPRIHPAEGSDRERWPLIGRTVALRATDEAGNASASQASSIDDVPVAAA
jgi:hypothetical protein